MKIFMVDNSLEIYYDGYRREHLFVLEDAMAKEEKVMNVNRGMDREEKLKALDAAITHIEKAYGKGSVMKLGDSGANMNIETVPTGSISLDIALGAGGVPKGRIIEI